MKKIVTFALASIVLLFSSCNSEESLQEYYVKNQERNDFIVIDVPSSMFIKQIDKLSASNQKAAKSIQKVNILAYPIAEGKQKEYTQEYEKLSTILLGEKYHTLLQFNHDGKKVKILYQGQRDAIEELIVLGNDDTKGFAVARILGNNMNPNEIITLLHSIKNENIDVENLFTELQNKV